MKTFEGNDAIRAVLKRTRQFTKNRRRQKRANVSPQHDDTTVSHISIERSVAALQPHNSHQMQRGQLVNFIRKLHQLHLRLRCSIDVFLNSISLFKRCLAQDNIADVQPTLLACLITHLSTLLIQSQPPSVNQLVVLGMYAFTKDQFLEAQQKLLHQLSFDIAHSFQNDIVGDLLKELYELGLEVRLAQWPDISFL